MRKPVLVPSTSSRAQSSKTGNKKLATPSSSRTETGADFRRRAGRKRGIVYLVGAGPGDPDLLTIKAVKVLQSADVILFDDLVSEEILEFSRAEAKRILVGKRGGGPSCRQDDINALMVKLGCQGKTIVRLKSGDPTIFGRAGEEIAILEAAGIPVRIIPGVTAATAAAAQLGVSLTHRDCAQAVKFVTAHSRCGQLPDIGWSDCTDAATTLIVYMGGRMAPLLAQRLLKEGADENIPVAIAWGVTRPQERYQNTTLGSLQSAQIDHKDPVLLCIGSVFSRAHKWLEENDSSAVQFDGDVLKKAAI